MKLVKVLTLAAFAVGSIGLSSCGCCTGEAQAPPLRPLPVFKDLRGAEELPISYDK